MAGVQGSALAIAVGHAGALVRCLAPCWRPMRCAPSCRRQASGLPHNVNFFRHTPPEPGRGERGGLARSPEALLRRTGPRCPAGPGRRPFDVDSAALLAEFKPRVVSFHPGCRRPICWRRSSPGTVRWASATTLREALWLEEHGADAVIAQGLEAGGHRGNS